MSDSGQILNDPEQTVTLGRVPAEDLRDRLPAYTDPAAFEDGPVPTPETGLVSLGFVWAAVQRSARLWCALAVVGLVLGAGYYAKKPPPHKASTAVLLVDDPAQNPVYEVQTDLVLAQSLPVATAVVRQLGLNQTPTSFLGTYTVAATTNNVVTITVGAPSSSEAVQRASAIASSFLAYRAQYEQTQQQQATVQLQQQVSQAQQRVSAVTKQIRQLTGQPSTPVVQARLTDLHAQLLADNNALQQVQSYATSTMATNQTVTQSMDRGSQVLNRALPLKSSGLKGALIYVGSGLAGGLIVGLAIVVIGAITSDRLRRRDDIAYAAGARVGLSVGRLRKGRIPSPRSGPRQREMDRVVEYLRHAARWDRGGSASLAVVAVDDAPTMARAVTALAAAGADQSKRVVVADLAAGAPAARILGVREPGVHKVNASSGTPIVVIVPAANDVAPIGPLKAPAGPSKRDLDQPDEQVSAACADADLVLSLVTLDPNAGGDHLVTWASDAIAVVTAGRATATRIHTAGEMVRLAGTHLESVLVVDADKRDESLGASTADQGQPEAARA